MVETTSLREERPKLSARDRLCLIQTINALPPTQFDELVFALNPPKGVVASSTAAQGTRSKDLLDWLEGSSGPGLAAADEVLQVLIPKATKTAPQPVAFVMSGKVSSSTASELQAFVELLRKKTGDNSIDIAFFQESSIKVILNGSPEGLTKLQEMFEAGELEQLDIPPVEAVAPVDTNTQEARKARFVQVLRLRGQSLSTPKVIALDLSGADLSGASLRDINLTESDLTGVNLSYADVTRTIFRNNPGLTETDKRYLKSRGAIFLFQDPPNPKNEQLRAEGIISAETIAEDWSSRLHEELPNLSQSNRQSIVRWLLGESPEQLATLPTSELAIERQAIEYRYRILQQRYWNVSPEEGYQRLIKRLSSLFLIRSKIKTWIALSRDRRRTVVDVIQEVIQEMMCSDRHLSQQLKWIATCTQSSRLRNLLMLASIEEYCLRPIRNQPLIIYRFVNYLRRNQKGGMTQVPTGELIRLVSDAIAPGDSEDSLSLLDVEAWNNYQSQQSDLEQQSMRHLVKTSFTNYLSRNLGDTAARWLELHLNGLSQEQIAQSLNMPVQQVYRLREKISYHAIRIFALREQPAMMLGWLKTSLQDHNFGLTPAQWDRFYQGLGAEEQAILTAYKENQPLDELARRLGVKSGQIQAQWVQIYLKAQELRIEN